jgi:diguanylate cyclase (GGDEF)-like protein
LGGAGENRQAATVPWSVLAALALAMHAVLPDGTVRDVVYLLLGAGACAAMVAGVARKRDADARGWWLLTAGVGLWWIGDALWIVLDRLVEVPPFPSPADAAYLAAYPLLTVGLLRVFRAPREHRVDWLLDALLVVGGVVLVLWQAVLDPAWVRWPAHPAAALTAAAYPLGDTILLLALVRPLASVRYRSRAHRLALLGVLAILVADIAFQLAGSHPALVDRTYLLDTLWLVGSTALAAAARQAADAQPVEPDDAGGLTGTQIALIAVSSAVVPATLVLAEVRGRPAPLIEVCVVGTVMLGSLLIRFTRVVRGLQDRHDRLARVAVTDPLTGLANTAGLARHLGRTRDDAQPTGNPALVLVSVDGYADVVEHLGHEAADALLRSVGAVLAATAPVGACSARLSRHVFALVADVTSAAEASDVAHRVRHALDRRLDAGGVRLAPRAALGVVVAGRVPAPLPELVARAEVALVAGRRLPGRVGQDERDAGPEPSGPRQGELLRDLEQAVALGQLVVHYQPVVSLREDRIAGAEALVRWEHPVLGLLGPAAFVPAAERTGLLRPVTLHVLDAALGRCARWRAQVAGFTVAVNVSADDVDDPGFPEIVARALDRHGLPAQALVVEVTETMAMRDLPQARQTLRALADLGVGLAVDDYGVGYGSLSYLRHLPFSTLKIDRTFVGPAADDPTCAAIVQSTVELAHALGMRVVAEGVEDATTRELLASSGCDLAQGWALGRPAAPDQLTDLIRADVAAGRAALARRTSRPGGSPASRPTDASPATEV